MKLNVFRTLRPLVSPLKLEIVRLEGTVRDSGQRAEAIYFGSGINREYLCGLFFESVQSHCLLRSHVASPRAFRMMRLSAGALMLSDLPMAWSYLSPLSAQITVPAWIRQEVHILGTSQPHSFKRSLVREISRHIRRQQYTVDFTSEPDSFKAFFHDLYAPYIRARFQKQAVVVSQEQFLAHCRGKTLARLQRREKWIAGMVLESHRSSLRFGWFGCIADPPPQGASEVLDALCIRYAKDRGFHKILFGNSRPSLADGVVRYKAKFGALLRPTSMPQAQLGIEIRDWRDDIAHILQANALLTHRNGRCYVYRITGPQERTRVQLEALK